MIFLAQEALSNTERFVAMPLVMLVAAFFVLVGIQGQDDDGSWGYTVFVYRDGLCWSCHERDLEPTGEHDVRETFYDGTSIRVRVDEQGRGHVVEE